MTKKYFLSLLFILFFSIQTCFGMSVEKAKDIVLQHYIQHMDEDISKTHNKFIKQYKKDAKYSTNMALVKNGIKRTNEYSIAGMYDGATKKLVGYEILYHKIPISFMYNSDGELIAYGVGYISEYGDERDNYVYFYKYLCSGEIWHITLLADDQIFTFKLDEGKLTYLNDKF